MKALDTNVVVRYLTGDDPAQANRAKAAVAAGPVFVSVSVLLETEWVLRSKYRLAGTAAVEVLRRFAGLRNVSVESAQLVAEAFDRAEAGMDFADALHLGAAGDCEAMLTFDRKFIRVAGDAPIGVVEP